MQAGSPAQHEPSLRGSWGVREEEGFWNLHSSETPRRQCVFLGLILRRDGAKERSGCMSSERWWAEKGENLGDRWGHGRVRRREGPDEALHTLQYLMSL